LHCPIRAVVGRGAGLPPWFQPLTFRFVAIAISFTQAWLRLKTGSIWAPIFLHASHNLWMQSNFPLLTSDHEYTKWVADDLHLAFIVVAAAVAGVFWFKRYDLRTDNCTICRQHLMTPSGTMHATRNHPNPVDNVGARLDKSASMRHRGRTEVDLGQLRIVAGCVMQAADTIAEIRWPGLDPDDPQGSAVGRVAAPELVAARLTEVVANIRGCALAAHMSADVGSQTVGMTRRARWRHT
jgi:hypothetical protein